MIILRKSSFCEVHLVKFFAKSSCPSRVTHWVAHNSRDVPDPFLSSHSFGCFFAWMVQNFWIAIRLLSSSQLNFIVQLWIEISFEFNHRAISRSSWLHRSHIKTVVGCFFPTLFQLFSPILSSSNCWLDLCPSSLRSSKLSILNCKKFFQSQLNWFPISCSLWFPFAKQSNQTSL